MKSSDSISMRAILALLAMGLAAHPAVRPASAVPTTLAGAVGGVQVPRSDLFTFHSDAFVNLHHFLYRWGQAGPGADTGGLDSRIRLRDEDLARYREMDAADRDEWDLAAAYYRVDVTIYANRVGGYTTADGHITVSSVDPGAQGWLGLELLFHEASHGDSMETPLRRLIRNAFDELGAEVPADLWHMTIFYTAGEVTRDVLTAAGEDYPQTYAQLAGIFERRESNARAKAALDAAWGDALDAGAGYRDAMERVARAWRE